MSQSPNSARSPAGRTSAAPWVGAAALLFAAAFLWWLFREPEPRRTTAPVDLVAPTANVLPAPAAEPPPPQETTNDGIAVMARGSADNSQAAPRHPHPITPAHERNFRQLNMVAVLNGAMDVGDVEELRRANRVYREEYPEATLLQEGYDLIADCLEQRSQATRAAAERYWGTAIASNLRRYVRRHCLE
jgi:hypothetical protein